MSAPRADIDSIHAQQEEQKTVIAQAQSTVALDQANLTFAQQENDRYASLARTGSGSIQNQQQAVSKLGIAKATLDRDNAAVAASEEQIGVLQATLSKAPSIARRPHARGRARSPP